MVCFLEPKWSDFLQTCCHETHQTTRFRHRDGATVSSSGQFLTDQCVPAVLQDGEMSAKKRPHRRMTSSPHLDDQTSQTLSGSPPQRSNTFSAAPKRRVNVVGSRAFQTRLCISTKISTCTWAVLCRVQQDITRKVLPSSQWLRECIWHCRNRKGTWELPQKCMFSFFPYLHRNTAQQQMSCFSGHFGLPWKFLEPNPKFQQIPFAVVLPYLWAEIGHFFLRLTLHLPTSSYHQSTTFFQHLLPLRQKWKPRFQL